MAARKSSYGKLAHMAQKVQGIEGVTTYSIGSDADRRIVIALDKKPKNRDANGDSAEA